MIPNPSSPRPDRHRAAALLIVLASLVFLAALALAFLASIGTELKSSKQYADGVSAKLLSQSAFNLATDQIVEATKGYGSANQTLAWASQPGMIRTYDSNGNKEGYFKLYSWDTMQGSGDFDPASSAEAISSTWYNDPAIYTDLNKPVTVNKTLQFPIVDGNNLLSGIKDSSGVTTVPGKAYDADGDGKWDIEGFSVSNSTPVASGSSANPMPMPVKWLYVLEGGQIVAPTGGSGNTATFSGSSIPTASNPIVGRIAFWTDDETCKVNINTASDGVYWDTPRVKSKQDDAYKINQPVSGEYQRYPGHPAMTSLSTIIKTPAGWSSGTASPTVTLGSGNAVSFKLSDSEWTSNQWSQNLYRIVPRIGTGGSNGGTAQSAMLPAGTAPMMTLDADRLYASVDELVFKPNRTSNNLELANLPLLTKDSLERARFFLTASSRAPDVNLFNKPRVSIWPITINPATGMPAMTAFDNLIAFCSTMRNDLGSGAYRYYFHRQDPTSPTTDLPTIGGQTGLNRNRTVLSYLRNLTDSAIPGFGKSFVAKYDADKDQILTEIFDYIRSTNLNDSTTGALPYTVGAPGTASIYPGWANAMGKGEVVPIVDGATDTRGFGRYPTVQGASVLFIGSVDGDDPLVPRNTDKTSRPTMPNYPGSTTPYPANTSQVDPAGKPLPVYSGTSDTIVTPAVAPGYMRVQLMFLPQFFCPAVGSTWLRQNYQWSADLSQLSCGPFVFPAETVRTINQYPPESTGLGDQQGMAPSYLSGAITATADIPKGSALSLTGRATIKIYAPSFANATPGQGTLVQTIELNFTNSPAGPVPSLAANQIFNKNSSNGWDDPNRQVYNYRYFSSSGIYNNGSAPDPLLNPSPVGYKLTGPPYDPAIRNPDTPLKSIGGRIAAARDTRNAQGFIMPGDVIRSVRVGSGDPRLVAAQTLPPPDLFEANPATDPVKGAHGFFNGYQMPYYGAELGRLAGDLAYSGYPTNSDTFSSANKQNVGNVAQNVFWTSGYTSAAAIPSHLNGVTVGSGTSGGLGSIPGDWDNAPFNISDGPYINKPDEGDVGNTNYEPYSWKLAAQSGGTMNNALFTPNRLIPSAVTFGSLSTGVKSKRPWQTLLFRPQPGHPGSKDYTGAGQGITGMPADHLLLDLFHMPVVEPYAITEPMSTAGRINMNYQIVPFTYINRDTGIRALLKSEKVIAIQDSQANVYKRSNYSTPAQASIRFDVNADETLKGFQQRFASKDIFRSASEICEVHVVPQDSSSTDDTYASMAAYWNTHRLTGDNSKERIYATLYPRLTTKSNTYTIHAKVQTLKKVPGSAPDVWTEGKDQVTGEYRGSQTIERYVDPNNPSIPDYADVAVTTPISNFYKTRVISSKQFAP